MLLAVASLGQREVSRFFRQRNRVIGAILPPFIFWFILGSGLSGSFQYSGPLNYLQFFFPGTIIMIVLFASIFSTISLIEDRKEGFLQSVMVSPISRSSIALGKISGGAFVAFLHGFLFLLLSPFLGAPWSVTGLLFGTAVLAIVSFGLTALGFFIAWRMDSTQGFHAVMNLFLMPMWFLSGAVFPMETAPGWLKISMTLNPLTYGVSALREFLFSSVSTQFPSPTFSILIISFFSVLMFVGAVYVCAKPERP